MGCFIEPKGFMTSYDKRDGKDPGASRLRQRPAEEARLVTQAPLDKYKDTDCSEIKTFLARAHPSSNEDSKGRLFVINRGPHGSGYLRCPRCEYAVAAKRAAIFGKLVPTEHKDPRTGEKCPVNNVQNPVELGHIFETDVRAFAFMKPLPSYSGEDADEKRTMFTRTLSESLRMACIRLLGTSSRDLAATFQYADTAYPIVVLYDTIAGGAGYVRRLCSNEANFTAGRILDKMAELLNCPNQCASSCSKCLNDYSNQIHWDYLNRIEVIKWMDSITNRVSVSSVSRRML